MVCQHSFKWLDSVLPKQNSRHLRSWEGMVWVEPVVITKLVAIPPHQRELCTQGLLGWHALGLGMLGRTLLDVKLQFENFTPDWQSIVPYSSIEIEWAGFWDYVRTRNMNRKFWINSCHIIRTQMQALWHPRPRHDNVNRKKGPYNGHDQNFVYMAKIYPSYHLSTCMWLSCSAQLQN